MVHFFWKSPNEIRGDFQGFSHEALFKIRKKRPRDSAAEPIWNPGWINIWIIFQPSLTTKAYEWNPTHLWFLCTPKDLVYFPVVLTKNSYRHTWNKSVGSMKVDFKRENMWRFFNSHATIIESCLRHVWLTYPLANEHNYGKSTINGHVQ